jgi:biopolymer transport protein ExbB
MKTLLLTALLTLSPLSLLAKTSDLELAYQKEFTFLKAQKRNLEKRFAELKKHNADKLAKTQETIDALQAKYLRLNTKADKTAQLLLQAERNEQDVSDNASVLDGTLSQSAATLKAFNYKVNTDAKNKTKELDKAFTFAAKQISELSKVRNTKGSFFLLDGTKVEGDIVKFGNIASYGVTAKNAVALVPAGNGVLKAWNQPAPESARALLKGEAKDTLNIFVFESADKEIASPTEKTLLDFLNSAGAIGWVIVTLGLVAVILMILRIVFLRDADQSTIEIRTEVAEKIRYSDKKEALKLCKNAKGSTARVLAATIRNIDKERDHLEDIVSEAVLHENHHLDRFGMAIMVIAAVAPLLGLLGTVTGMISTFDIITEFGTGDPAMLSGGISEALVTTELGLIVAIPALLVGNLLSGWSEKIKDHMEQAALHVNNIYLSNKNA